jgi:hypothetical protein
MIRYDSVLTATGYPPGGSVDKLAQKQERHTNRETVHKTEHKHRAHKIEIKHTKQENKHERNIENRSRAIRKPQKEANNDRTCQTELHTAT